MKGYSGTKSAGSLTYKLIIKKQSTKRKLLIVFSLKNPFMSVYILTKIFLESFRIFTVKIVIRFLCIQLMKLLNLSYD